MSYPEQVGLAVEDAAGEMGRLDPGAMAALRRMTADNPAPAFWKIAVRHEGVMLGNQRDKWVAILRFLAVITPRGAPETRPKPLHVAGRKHHLGAALCDGGNPEREGGSPGWDGKRPVMSERRLAQLLATRGTARIDALARAARLLATTRDPKAGIDVRSVAWAFLAPDSTNPIAEAYYRCLDNARGSTEEKTR